MTRALQRGLPTLVALVVAALANDRGGVTTAARTLARLVVADATPRHRTRAPRPLVELQHRTTPRLQPRLRRSLSRASSQPQAAM